MRIKSGTNEGVSPMLDRRLQVSTMWSRRFGTVAAVVVVALTAGCASHRALAPGLPRASGAGIESEQARQWMSEHQHVVAIHRSKCGACHTPVEPGSVPRAEVASALQRHRQRAKLSERDWADMVEYLSSDGALFPRRSASLP
jgi:hypothetical protein